MSTDTAERIWSLAHGPSRDRVDSWEQPLTRACPGRAMPYPGRMSSWMSAQQLPFRLELSRASRWWSLAGPEKTTYEDAMSTTTYTQTKIHVTEHPPFVCSSCGCQHIDSGMLISGRRGTARSLRFRSPRTSMRWTTSSSANAASASRTSLWRSMTARP
jgi:hypothetical protein